MTERDAFVNILIVSILILSVFKCTRFVLLLLWVICTQRPAKSDINFYTNSGPDSESV